MSGRSAVGIYVPIALILFTAFLLFVLRSRPKRRDRLGDGEGNTTDY